MKPKVNFSIKRNKANSIIAKMMYISKMNQLGYILCNNKLKVIK